MKLYFQILRRDEIQLIRKGKINISVFYILKCRGLFYSVDPTRLVYVISSTRYWYSLCNFTQNIENI